MEAPNLVFSCPIHIRYSDTDQMGVVHNSVYAIYCEQGRTELCAAQGLPYHLMEADGLYMMVAEMSGRYHRAIRYGDQVSIYTTVERLRRKLITFRYQIIHDESGELCYSGHTTHLFSQDLKKTCALPEKYFSKFNEILKKDQSGK